jgi:diguanylate cyclase (GGDEF)-like protein/PAS domain S-box-containing protein
MALVATTGLILRVNIAAGEIVERRPVDMVGTPLSDVVHHADRDAVLAQLDALVTGGIVHLRAETRVLADAGRVVWVTVHASCIRDDDGTPLYVMCQVEDITESRQTRERLAHAAIHDPLTDLPNRDLFVDRLEMALRRSRRGGHRVAVMFLDLDRFKMVNDTHGHEVGDRLLRAVSDRMSGALRASDTLARFGGDEFTVLCDEVADEAHVLEIADRLRSTMNEPLTEAGGETNVTFSVGIALSSDGSEAGSTLLRQADVAMYRAKERGPSRVEIYTEDHDDVALTRLRTSNELRDALDSDELELWYQPFVDLHTHTMVGMEALVRWRHPTRGVLLPDQFIPMAEDSGLIVPLGAWALRETCRQTAAWDVGRNAAGLDEARLNVSVNVASLQLADPGFPDLVADVLATTGINPDRLWLELTESTLMGDPESTIEILHALRAIGLHIIIDDFGTGYSSLAYLNQFPVETLKIDPTFVQEVDLRSEDTAVVRAIIGLGDSLGLSVIAEGVERWAQIPILQTLGCHLAQGYLLGAPLRAGDIGAFPSDEPSAWYGPLESTGS